MVKGAKGLERQLLGSLCHTEWFPQNVLAVTSLQGKWGGWNKTWRTVCGFPLSLFSEIFGLNLFLQSIIYNSINSQRCIKKILSISFAHIHHYLLPGMLSVTDFHIFPLCWFHHQQTQMCTHHSVLEMVVFIWNHCYQSHHTAVGSVTK